LTAQTLSEHVAAIVSETPFEALSGAAVERAKVSLAHNFAVGLAGRGRETVAHVLAARVYGSPAEATLLHTGGRASLEGAAFANGALFHARSQDDTHPDSTTHPGSPIIATALALSETLEATGEEFLGAVILGYEALCRIGRDFDQQVTQRGFRAAPVFGIFGAAAAAARLLRLDRDQTGHALGLASHMAGGLAQVWQEGSPEFPLQLGFAARNGIAAARAAAVGARAARGALDGAKGFYNAYAGVADDPAEARASHGRWQVEESTVKPFPACAILQGPLQLLLEMLRDEAIAADAIEEISVELSPYEAAYPGVDNAGPFSSSTATKMSAQFCLANAVVRHRLALTDLERCGDPQIMDLAPSIRVRPNPAVADRLCRIALCLRDGRRYTRDLREPVGRPSFAEVCRFAVALSDEMGLPAADVQRFLDIIDRLELEKTVRPLVAALAVQPTR